MIDAIFLEIFAKLHQFLQIFYRSFLTACHLASFFHFLFENFSKNTFKNLQPPPLKLEIFRTAPTRGKNLKFPAAAADQVVGLHLYIYFIDQLKYV